MVPSGPSQVRTCHVGSRPGPSGGAGRYCVPFAWSGLFRCLGAQRPVAPPARRGSPFLPRNGEKEGRGQAPWTPGFYGRSFPLAGFCGGCLCNGRGTISSGILRPIWNAFFGKKYAEKAFLRKNISAPLRLHPPKPSPWGEGGPAKPGRMRGRPCTQPFLVEKRRSPDCRLNEVFLLLRWACRSPPHQSPSVTASPQGEASGLCSPTRKSAPNQGT